MSSLESSAGARIETTAASSTGVGAFQLAYPKAVVTVASALTLSLGTGLVGVPVTSAGMNRPVVQPITAAYSVAAKRTRQEEATQMALDSRTAEPIPALLALEFSMSEEMQDDGFPFNVPDQLTEEQAAELDTVRAAGAPTWVRDLRAQIGKGSH